MSSTVCKAINYLIEKTNNLHRIVNNLNINTNNKINNSGWYIETSETINGPTTSGPLKINNNDTVRLIGDIDVKEGSILVDFTKLGPTGSIESDISANIYFTYEDACVSLLIINPSTNQRGGCSGFFIKSTSTNGPYIVTCAHCSISKGKLKERSRVFALITNFNNNGEDRLVECDIIGIDGASDIAVVRPRGIQYSNSLVELEWGDSRNTKIGSTCYVIGNPYGLDHQSISKGVIRDNKGTEIGGIQPCENIFVDASTSRGNSGSPILDINGKVIGILSFINEGHSPDGDGHANDISGGVSQYIIQHVVENIIKGNGTSSKFTDEDGDYTKKGYLGIDWKPVSMVDVYDNDGVDTYNVRGIVVESLDPTGGISMHRESNTDSWIKEGDWITEIDGVTMGDKENQVSPGSITWFKVNGEKVNIKYVKPSDLEKTYTVEVTLGIFPNENDFPINNTKPNV